MRFKHDGAQSLTLLSYQPVFVLIVPHIRLRVDQDEIRIVGILIQSLGRLSFAEMDAERPLHLFVSRIELQRNAFVTVAVAGPQ